MGALYRCDGCVVCWRCPPGYYAEVTRPESPRAAENRRLVAEIRVIHVESRRTYGSPRIHATLQAPEQRIGVHRVARPMPGRRSVRRAARRGGPRRIRRMRIPSCRIRSIVDHAHINTPSESNEKSPLCVSWLEIPHSRRGLRTVLASCLQKPYVVPIFVLLITPVIQFTL